MSECSRPLLMIRKLCRDKCGFTLVEVMVAAVVFAVVFLMIATLFARATTDFAGTRLLTATMLAQASMEAALRAQPLDSRTWTVTANRVRWEMHQVIDRISDDMWTIQIIVSRQSDGKEYARLWTQVYRSNP